MCKGHKTNKGYQNSKRPQPGDGYPKGNGCHNNCKYSSNAIQCRVMNHRYPSQYERRGQAGSKKQIWEELEDTDDTTTTHGATRVICFQLTYNSQRPTHSPKTIQRIAPWPRFESVHDSNTASTLLSKLGDPQKEAPGLPTRPHRLVAFDTEGSNRPPLRPCHAVRPETAFDAILGRRNRDCIP